MGGATAANQYEGDGKGKSIAVRMLTDEIKENPRRIYCKADNIYKYSGWECIPFGFHPFDKESEYYPSHNATVFIIVEDIKLMAEMGF
ncbi:MAG: hypothetical protein ACLRQF_17665 [Thomasclavelia ramosa]